MVVATWNVNSIRSRLMRVIPWLQVWQPDVLLLQELKTPMELLPLPAFWALGYQVAAFCERVWNGVAIVSRRPMSEIVLGFQDGGPEHEARLISALVDGVRVMSVYVPHGRALDHEMYAHKLAFLARLRKTLDARHKPDDPVLLAGDFNVVPETKDVWDPKGWANHPHFHVKTRVALKDVIAFGLHDAFRIHNPQPGFYSWWDYKLRDAFEKNRGLRIDHVYVTEPLAKRCTFAAIDRLQRMGVHPSDHAPVMVQLT